MRKVAGFFSIVFLLLSATYVTSGDNVKLKLKAPRTIFMKPAGMNRYQPASVQVRAELEGTPEDPEKYYCLEVEWEWGDDTKSLHEPDCDPFEEGAEIQRRFSSSHTYRYPGNYIIWLRLQKSGDTVIAKKITVRIQGQD
jgi:hypothetical protein